TTAAGGSSLQAIAWMEFDADLLGPQHARLAALRQQAIVMRFAVLAAEHAARSVARAIARSVATRRLFGLQHQIEGDAEAAAKLAVATRTFTEFMTAEVQGKARFGNLNAAEFETANRVPFADRRPAISAR